MKAPFIYFGGKREVAPLVWAALGDPDNYVEPFAGSLAVLLERPAWHEGRTETVNDLDRYLSNFWRSLSKDPEAVAAHADWPVNETDLEARHLWLVNEGRAALARLGEDPDAYDARVAGWWVWGINSWIGSGWCSGTGPWVRGADGRVEDARKLPHLGDAGRGINRKLPHLRNAGRGINRKLPHLRNAGLGDGLMPRDEALRAYLGELAARLRGVRVCCGDWGRVVTPGALSYGSTVGVFLDPPYQDAVRTKGLYAQDGGGDSLSVAVRDWALKAASDPGYFRGRTLRIVLAGYEDEHEDYMPPSWRRHAYSARAAYQSASGNGVNTANRAKERLWFSPSCLVAQRGLFA